MALMDQIPAAKPKSMRNYTTGLTGQELTATKRKAIALQLAPGAGASAGDVTASQAVVDALSDAVDALAQRTADVPDFIARWTPGTVAKWAQTNAGLSESEAAALRQASVSGAAIVGFSRDFRVMREDLAGIGLGISARQALRVAIEDGKWGTTDLLGGGEESDDEGAGAGAGAGAGVRPGKRAKVEPKGAVIRSSGGFSIGSKAKLGNHETLATEPELAKHIGKPVKVKAFSRDRGFVMADVELADGVIARVWVGALKK